MICPVRMTRRVITALIASPKAPLKKSWPSYLICFLLSQPAGSRLSCDLISIVLVLGPGKDRFESERLEGIKTFRKASFVSWS